MKDFVFFSLSENKKTAEKLAAHFNGIFGKVSKTYFSDGEVLIKTETEVQGKDVIVVESTSRYAETKIFDLLLLIDSINRGGARSIRLFIPYFGYSRQERSYHNEPVSCEVVARILETANYSSLSSFDFHHPMILNFFKKEVKNLETSSLFVDYYLTYFKENNIDINDVVIVAPDHGANQRIECLVHELNAKKIILKKVRPQINIAEHLQIDDDVKGKTCIIIDDIIDTGGTIVSATNLLYRNGAHSVLVGASHAVFSGNCLRNLKEACVKDIVVTNTIEKDLPSDVKILDILPLIAKEII